MTTPAPSGTYNAVFTGPGFTLTGQVVLSAPAPAPTDRLGARVRLGAFTYQGLEGGGGAGTPYDPAPHLALEKALGVTVAPVSMFLGWDTDLPVAQLAAYGSRDILVSWQPTNYTASQILAGAANAYIDRFAAAVAAHTGGTVYVRLMPEMNGNWSPWYPGGPMGVTSPAHYVQVWQYVVARVKAKTSKTRWVFCPNITDTPGVKLEDFWPGSGYVHILGFDGYNWGTSGYGNFLWTSFHDLLGTPQGGASASIYDRLAALNAVYPIWVCEFGCKDPSKEDGKTTFGTTAVTAGLSPADPTRSKAQWYTDLFNLTGYPRLTTLVAFSITKERDWRIDTDPAVVAAIAAGLAR